MMTLENAYWQRLQKYPFIMSTGFDIYYLQRRFQSLSDIYVATGNQKYLNAAKTEVLKCIDFAIKNTIVSPYNNERYATWVQDDLVPVNGGHSQTLDFQGALGLCHVAQHLKDRTKDLVVQFIERSVIHKWFLGRREFKDYASFRGLIGGARGKWALLCALLNELEKLGAIGFPYKEYCTLMAEELLSIGTDKTSYNLHNDNGYLLWYLEPKKPIIRDTSHANRTAWLIIELGTDYIKKLLVKTFRDRIWRKDLFLFGFSDFIDGRIKEPPCFEGNVYFGWHRLSEFDTSIKSLFLDMARNIADYNGDLFPKTQNLAAEGPLCLLAYGCRIEKGKL